MSKDISILNGYNIKDRYSRAEIEILKSGLDSLSQIFQNFTLGKPTIINGTFVFNDTIPNINLYEPVICKSGGTTATVTAFKVIKGETSPQVQVQLLKADGSVSNPIVYKNGGWTATAWKKYIFDTIVSDTFYNFVIDNSPKVLNGTYIFNESVIDMSGFHYYVQFTCDNSTYFEIYGEQDGGFAYIQGDLTENWVHNGLGAENEWVDQKYRTITFDNQTVDDDFYNWLNTHATKV